MPLLSYAQNGEDVVLYRALKDIEHGHYIDIGASDPVDDSVTKIFYDHGWSGINVEPSISSFERLVAARPRDLNLRVAVSVRAGVVRLNDVCVRGLSTLDPGVAADAQRRGLAIEMIDVPVLSLADICRGLSFDVTHFLKIDVEGSERDVLLGADFTVFRPWIIVVKATRPNSTERLDSGWRDLLDGAGYDCTLFDGLNLYFLAREHVDLRERLAAPANVLDDYVPARFIDAQAAERDAFAAERARIETALEAERSTIETAFGAERDERAAERARLEATFGAERARLEAAFEAQRDWFVAERARLEALVEGERADAEGQQGERHRLGGKVDQLAEELLQARKTAQISEEALERELGKVRLQARAEAERHLAQHAVAQGQLAHYKMQDERLRQISDLTGDGTHLEERGSELQDLRASLLRQADAWEAEVEDLRQRLEEALAWPDVIKTSTSWRVTSPLRSIRRGVQGLRHGPGRFSRLVGQCARNLLGRPCPSDVSVDDIAVGEPAPSVETDVLTFVSLIAGIDSEMAFLVDLLDRIPSVLSEDNLSIAGPFYAEARLDEQLTQWIRADVVRQRRAAF